mgnify:CR=1 FL=1
MTAFFGGLSTFLNNFHTQAYILISLACIIYGVILNFSEDGTEKLKKRAPLIVVGWLLLMGGVSIGSGIGSEMSF